MHFRKTYTKEIIIKNSTRHNKYMFYYFLKIHFIWNDYVTSVKKQNNNVNMFKNV